jgi:hypothetical protein
MQKWPFGAFLQEIYNLRMQQKSFLFLVLLIAGLCASAQIKLVGTHYNPTSQLCDVLRFDASTGSVLNTVATPEQGMTVGASVFDAYTGSYYFRGLTGLNRVSFDPDSFAHVGSIAPSAATEIDMANGLIFGVDAMDQLDSLGNIIGHSIVFKRYDLATNTEVLLDSITSILGVVLDASAYNSNTGEYYFIGQDHAGGMNLYTVPTRTLGGFTYSQLSLALDSLSIAALEYDNERNVLYGLASIDLGASQHFQLRQIDPVTGVLTLEADWPQITQFQIGAHSYDQTTGSFILSALDSLGLSLRIYNTVQNTLTNGVLPLADVSELEVDNYEFALMKYATSITPASKQLLQLYPNPAASVLHITGAALRTLSVYDASGRLVHTRTGGTIRELEVGDLIPGMYFLQGQAIDGNMRQGKFIKE